MCKWLFGWLLRDTFPKPEEYLNGGTECSHESVQVRVDMEMPDFLTETAVEMSVKQIEQSVSTEDVNDDRDIVIDKPTEVSDSLLDNRQLVNVFSECADLLNEIDRISPGFKSPESQLLIEMINERLRSVLYLSGGSIIEGELSFDPIRHTCPENLLAKDGATICQTIEPGVALESRVFVKAKVKLAGS